MIGKGWKRQLGYWLYLVFAVGCQFLLLEGSLRALAWWQFGVPGKSYGLWRYDAELGAIHKENAYNSQVQTNNYGFRNIEDVREPKPPGSMRVITYGGSTTFCYDLGDRQTWPYLLEQSMRSRPGHEHDEVLNAGAVYWSLGHALARARRDIPLFKPDQIIIYSGINETLNAALLSREGTPLEGRLRAGQCGAFTKGFEQVPWYARNLALYRFVKYRLGPLLLADPRPMGPLLSADATHQADPVVLENFLCVLREFIALARKHGAEPIYIIETAGKPDVRLERLTEYSRAGALVAARSGVRVIDPAPLLRHRPWQEVFQPSGIHYTMAGAKAFSRLIYEELYAPRAQ